MCVLHIPLGLVLVQNPQLSTLHAQVALAIGIAGVLAGAGAGWAGAAAGYLVGADVVWRMSGAGVFHQYGKYGIAFLMGLWMLRNNRLILRTGPVLYLLALLPSVAVVVAAGGVAGRIQQPLSFNLSGPISLAVSVVFFQQAHLRREEVLRIFAVTAMPVFCVSAIAANSTMQATDLTFAASNMITSGGWGPNQVASILGMGFFFFFLLFLLVRPAFWIRAFLLCGALLLGVQCALTFSRGGPLLGRWRADGMHLLHVRDPSRAVPSGRDGDHPHCTGHLRGLAVAAGLHRRQVPGAHP